VYVYIYLFVFIDRWPRHCDECKSRVKSELHIVYKYELVYLNVYIFLYIDTHNYFDRWPRHCNEYKCSVKSELYTGGEQSKTGCVEHVVSYDISLYVCMHMFIGMYLFVWTVGLATVTSTHVG